MMKCNQCNLQFLSCAQLTESSRTLSIHKRTHTCIDTAASHWESSYRDIYCSLTFLGNTVQTLHLPYVKSAFWCTFVQVRQTVSLLITDHFSRYHNLFTTHVIFPTRYLINIKAVSTSRTSPCATMHGCPSAMLRHTV